MTDPSRLLFRTYFKGQSQPLGGDDAERVEWFARYARVVYQPWFHVDPARMELLEVGCGKGLLLRALEGMGVANLSGIDLSGEDCQVATRGCPAARIEQAEAADFLRKRPGTYDTIIMKAVLEHVPRQEVVELLKALVAALRPGGRAIIEVPNMDWLFATHERYMDFTHRTGFTRESLRQVLSLEFDVLDVLPVDQAPFFDDVPWRRKLSRFVLGRLLSWSDPQGGNGPIWCRSLVAVCRAPLR